jgi:ribosomal protein S27AE
MRSPIEEGLCQLLSSNGEKTAFTRPEIIEALTLAGVQETLDPAAIDRALFNLYSFALLSFFWEKESGMVFLPDKKKACCPKCGRVIDMAQSRGHCAGCGVVYVMSDRKKPFRRV